MVACQSKQDCGAKGNGMARNFMPKVLHSATYTGLVYINRSDISHYMYMQSLNILCLFTA